MKPLRILASCSVLALLALASVAPAAQAAPAPAWNLTLTPMPANFAPGEEAEILALATNVGAAPTVGQSKIEVVLPDDLSPLAVSGNNSTPGSPNPSCAIALQEVSCAVSSPVPPDRVFFAQIRVEVAASPSGSIMTTMGVSGGGAQALTAAMTPPLQSTPPPFGFEPPGLRSPLSADDGAAAGLAGSHPYQQTVDFGFPTEETDGGLTNAGHPRNIDVELPPGLIGNPAATPVLCTEAELQRGKCPAASQVGVLDLTTLAGKGIPTLATSAVFSMVPPAGAPAMLATDVATIGLYAHLIAGVRSDGDYGIEVRTPDVIALGATPIFDLQTQIWGDPSSPSHDQIRGQCTGGPGSCPVQPQKTAFLTMPSQCTGSPIVTSVRADTWEEPGLFRESTYGSANLEGNPVEVAGCNALDFEPTISSQPTTNLSDSPSGLDFVLHQPQDTELGHISPANLKDAVVTLPAGMSVNPSQADGLAACTEQEIGFEAQREGIHFSKQPDNCPDAAKLGTVEVSTPLLVQRDTSHKLVVDPETGNPKPDPLHGSVYLAKPLDNPFGSLVAIYLSVSDPKTGIVSKLAGRAELDPSTGQITTRFSENPQLPLEDIKVHLFGGARGALIMPLSCGTHTTTTTLTPWSTPEGVDAHPSDSFQTVAAPGGGNCPASDSGATNKPAFQAGTIAPQAGAYTPFVLKIAREDGSQRIGGIDATLPPGLTGKLAGIPRCSDAQLAQAIARSHPNEGAIERASPSCPASSQVGTVDVAAGAGPIPYHTQGNVYLAGPYKGAPISVAIVTPAVAGPFDLGAVVVRNALYIDTATAQIHAVSDPIPQIIDGIPLDVRSIALTMDRPSFTLNPTSCDPMTVLGSATSSLGQSAALQSPFQVGGCAALAFKPKLSLKLEGGTKRAAHPQLIANLRAKPGEANIASAQVKLPPSAFLDQAHIRTVCTRVQFAADDCPKGSIYGEASATTPLLDQPLTGNVYLRSSSHKLPDLVVALKGPASLPIEVDLAGKTDSVKGALRNTFEAVPDAPVSQFHLELFGGKRGLVVNSRDLCKHPYRAEVKLDGQNGKVFDTQPIVKSDCKGNRPRRGH